MHKIFDGYKYSISQEWLTIETWFFCYAFVMVWTPILQVQIRYFNMGQHSLSLHPNCQKDPIMHLFREKYSKNINCILEYKTTQ